jgi:polysaccharide biosynthesis/export protein
MRILRILSTSITVACVMLSLVQAQTSKNIDPTTRPYLLGPGDVVEVSVFGPTDINRNFQVDGDGNLNLPFLEPLLVKCRSERQVHRDITEAYKRLIKEPQVSLRLVDRNSRQPATIFGAVRQATKVPTVKTVRLNEMIAASGGFTEKAAGTIQILHTEPVMCPEAGNEAEGLPLNPSAIPFQVVKIADLQKGVANPVIRSGDIVLVTEAEPVYIVGSVVSPGSIMLRDRLTLSRALGMVGGPQKEAKLSEIRIYRQKGGPDQQEVLKFNYAEIKKNQRPDVFLQPYDVIEVSDNGIFEGKGWLHFVVNSLAGGLRSALLGPIPF